MFILTFISYTSYHLSKKPFSVVKVKSQHTHTYNYSQSELIATVCVCVCVCVCRWCCVQSVPMPVTEATRLAGPLSVSSSAEHEACTCSSSSLLHISLLQTHTQTHTLRQRRWQYSVGQFGLHLAVCLCCCNVHQVTSFLVHVYCCCDGDSTLYIYAVVGSLTELTFATSSQWE